MKTNLFSLVLAFVAKIGHELTKSNRTTAKTEASVAMADDEHTRVIAHTGEKNNPIAVYRLYGDWTPEYMAAKYNWLAYQVIEPKKQPIVRFNVEASGKTTSAPKQESKKPIVVKAHKMTKKPTLKKPAHAKK